MKNERAHKIYALEVKGYKQTEIAQKMKLSESTVSKEIKKITKSREYQLGVYSVNTFMEMFQRAQDFWNNQNTEYEELIEEVNKIKIDTKDKNRLSKLISKVDAISRIKEKQDKNMERILLLAKQGEIVLALKVLRPILQEIEKKPMELAVINSKGES